MKRRTTSTTRQFETAVAKLGNEVYVFQLYVAGTSRHSMNAIKNLKVICERYLKGGYQMDIIDIHKQPPIKSSHLIAAPTLIKKLPLPVRRLIGDMSDTPKILFTLNITEQVV